MAASVITVLPMCGDYYTNTYLTGGRRAPTMVGNQIVYFLGESTQPQVGASLVLILMAMLARADGRTTWSTPHVSSGRPSDERCASAASASARHRSDARPVHVAVHPVVVGARC